MSLIGASNVLATAFCMFLVMGTQKKMGLAVYTVFGNAFSALVQFSLIFFVVSADLTPTLTQLSSSPLILTSPLIVTADDKSIAGAEL